MSEFRWLAVGIAVCLLGANVRAEEPDVAKALVGKWVVTKSEEGGPPVGTVAEFSKDGTIKVTMKKDEKDATMEGTYKVEAKKFICTFKDGDKEKSMTHDVVKLTDEELTFTFDGKTIHAKKKS